MAFLVCRETYFPKSGLRLTPSVILFVTDSIASTETVFRVLVPRNRERGLVGTDTTFDQILLSSLLLLLADELVYSNKKGTPPSGGSKDERPGSSV